MRFALLALFLLPMSVSAALAAEGCSNSYIRRTDSVQKQSSLYLIQVPAGFSSSIADVKATYKSISSRQNPTHQCVFNPPLNGVGYYRTGFCKNLQTGRVTSIYGGSGYRIASDGNTTVDDSCNGSGSSCAYIEDSNNNRIVITDDIANTLDYVGHVINDCRTGVIEGVSFRQAFPGYIILEYAIEKGFVNTYNSAPNIKF